MTNGNQLTREEQAMLVEYQVCQQSQNSTTQSYWTLSGIFIGISTVLLGGLIYGYFANNDNLTSLRIIALILGIAMIVIISTLWLWLSRINYLTDTNYARMREIEIALKMSKSLRLSAIDEWRKQKLGNYEKLTEKKIGELWGKIKDKLCKGISEQYAKELENSKRDIITWCNSYNRQSPQKWYQKPSRHLHYPVIYGTLLLLWLLVIIGTIVSIYC